MKKIFIIISFFLFSCTDEFVPDNPLDPDNPDYIPPIVTIISGPEESSTVNVSEVTFRYEGNEEAMLYRTKFNSDMWSAWKNQSSATYDYLDEGSHWFGVQSMYTTGDTSDVAGVSFTVNAVSGPALIFYPRRHVAVLGEVVQFQIRAEEIVDLTAAEFTFEYNQNALEIISITQGTIFQESGESFFFTEDDNGSITISTALWNNEEPSVTGTHDIAIIEIQVLQTAESELTFDGSETFRDALNNSINISATVNGLVTSQ
jgi:hypothetical protein